MADIAAEIAIARENLRRMGAGKPLLSQTEQAEREFEETMGGQVAPSTFDERVAPTMPALERGKYEVKKAREAKIRAGVDPAAAIRESPKFKAEEEARATGGGRRGGTLGLGAAMALAAQPERRTISVANPMHAPVQEYAGATTEAMSEREAGIKAQHNVEDSIALENQRQALHLAGLADEFQKQQRVTMARQREQMAEQQSAMREVQKLHDQAVTDLVNAPPLDPGKAREDMWAKASHGRRFGLILSVLGKGLAAAGGLNITSRLEQEVENEIAANKYNRDFLATRIGARAQQLQGQQTIYERLRSQFEDEGTADAAFRATMYDYATKTYEATLAQFGPAQVDATQMQTLAELKAKDAAAKLELQQLVVKNPRTVKRAVKSENVVIVDPATGEPAVVPRWYAKELAKQGIEVSTAVATAAGKEAVEQPGRLQLEGVRQAGAAATKRAEKEGEADAEIKEKTLAFGTIEQMIDDFLAANTGDIAGHGLPLTGERGERISVDQFKTIMPEMITNAITGAHSEPEQREAFRRLVTGDWNDLTDEDFRNRLRSLKNLVTSQRRYLQNKIGPTGRQVERTSEFGTFKSGIE